MAKTRSNDVVSKGGEVVLDKAVIGEIVVETNRVSSLLNPTNYIYVGEDLIEVVSQGESIAVTGNGLILSQGGKALGVNDVPLQFTRFPQYDATTYRFGEGIYGMFFASNYFLDVVVYVKRVSDNYLVNSFNVLTNNVFTVENDVLNGEVIISGFQKDNSANLIIAKSVSITEECYLEVLTISEIVPYLVTKTL